MSYADFIFVCLFFKRNLSITVAFLINVVLNQENKLFAIPVFRKIFILIVFSLALF